MTTIHEEVTQGDPLTFYVQLQDASEDPLDLTGWEIAAGFRDQYKSDAYEFELTIGNGLYYFEDDPTTGRLKVVITDDMTSAIPVKRYVAKDYDIPYNIVVGDIKLTPPDGVELLLEDGRPVIFLKVKASVTT